MARRNGRPPDCPPWGWVIIQQMNKVDRQLDRVDGQLDKTARQVEETGRQVKETGRQVRETGKQIKVMAEAMVRVGELVTMQQHHLIDMRRDMKTFITGQQEHTKLLHDILRTLRIQGNGKGGNGRGDGQV